jgi:hypothetical protein
MPEVTVDIQYRFFVVGDRPQCLWDMDISKRVLGFLDSIDPTFFEYSADAHLAAALEDKSQSAAMAIRGAYSQALETLFALLSAFLQAPRCVPAWMARYARADLKVVVTAISKGQKLLAQVDVSPKSWRGLSHVVHQWLVLEDKEKETQLKDGFGDAWSRFASDFLNEDFYTEYNNIKHGLRARPGGFQFAMGPELEPGVPAPAESMTVIGKSDFGSSLLVAEKIRNSPHHLRLRQHHRNWDPEDLSWGLHIISMSIQNVISALKILNDVPATTVQFQWPTDQQALGQPWSRLHKVGVISMTGLETLVPDSLIKEFSKEEIFARYGQGKDGGIVRHRFPEATPDGRDVESEENHGSS